MASPFWCIIKKIMEEKDNNIKEVQVILPEENEEENKKKKKRLVILLVMLCVLVGDVAGILAYFATVNNYHSGGNSDSGYVISEESTSIYNNLLTFIKNACGTDYPHPTDIVAVNYQDNNLLVSSKNDTNEIYVTYTHEGGITSALSEFTNNAPSLIGYSIESAYTISEDKPLNDSNYVRDDEHIGIVTKSITNKYFVSFTGLCNCGAYKSVVHQEYNDEGIYDSVITAKQEENKVLFDLLYIVTNGFDE